MQTLYLDWFTQLSPLQKPSAALPLRSALAPTCTRTSLTKPGAAGTMKKPRWYCDPGLPGVSPTALVPEWRNWQTR